MKTINNKYAVLSLLSTIVTAVLTSIHHAYEIGFMAIILALVMVATPLFSMQRFKQTGSNAALWICRLITAWLVVGFGLVDGLWNHIINPLSFQFKTLLSFHGGGSKMIEKSVEKSFDGNFIYNWTGILTFAASMFAAFYGYKFIQTIKHSDDNGMQNN